VVRYVGIVILLCGLTVVSSGFVHSTPIDTRIAEIKAEIQQAQIRLKQAQQQKQKKHLQLAEDLELDARSHPLFPIDSPYLAKDYTRYPVNPYPNYFQYISEDKLNEIEFHFWFQGDMDSLMNINGLLVNDGRIQVPIGRSNSIQRYWIRRGRPNVQGDVYQFINYFINVDFGMNNFAVYDAFLDINYYRLLGLEFGEQMSLVSGIENYFDNFSYLSRAFTMEMSHSAMLAPDRQFGFNFHGSFGPSGEEPYYRGLSVYGFDDFFSYQVAFLTGTADNQTSNNNFDVNEYALIQETNLAQYDFEWRFFMNPFIDKKHHLLQHLGFGLAGSTGVASNQKNLPALVSIAQNIFYYYETNYDYNTYEVVANGNRNRLHPQAVWSFGPLGIIGDWTQTTQTLAVNSGKDVFLKSLRQKNQASQISFIYNLTQEEFNLFHFFPKNNFHVFEKGALGGFQLVGRLSALQLDPKVFQDTYQVTNAGQDYTFYYFVDPRISIQKATSWSIGLNWYWNANLRFTFEYDQSSYIGGCSTGAMNANTGTPGCQMGSPDTYLTTSQVINRPDEKVYMQRVQLTF
jgi:phosphate-selective porin OprO/OprP